jgi:DNA invertase Pin-like site-specific DNA recombinase
MVQETIIADLRKRGFELISVMEPDLLQNDPSRTLMRQIFGAIAEYDKAIIVAKLRGARQRMKVATGRCEGRKPYGSHAGEAEVLERMRVMRQSGLSSDGIAVALNAEGVAGKRWHGLAVNQILSTVNAAVSSRTWPQAALMSLIGCSMKAGEGDRARTVP